jgi:hypothetical protein
MNDNGLNNGQGDVNTPEEVIKTPKEADTPEDTGTAADVNTTGEIGAAEDVNPSDDVKIPAPDTGKYGIKYDPILAFKRSRDKAFKEALIEQSKEAEAEAEAERKKREAYAKKLADERRDLLKIKAGIADDEVIEEFSPEEKDDTPLPLGKRIANFWYHRKAVVIVSTLVVIAIVYLIGTIIFKVEPDVRILIIKTDPNFTFLTDDIADALAPYCPDFNGDGKVYIQVAYNPVIPSEGADPNYIQAQSARLFVEFNSSDTALLFTDQAALDALDIERSLFDNPADFFGESPAVNDLGYRINATDLGNAIGYPDMGDDIYAVFRLPIVGKSSMGTLEEFERNYASAHMLWENYITGTVINPDQKNYTP